MGLGEDLNQLDSVQLLRTAADGDAAAEAALYQRIYTDLRKRAGRLMGSERRDHTLQATVLVHEAWMRLSLSQTDWASRSHFLAYATRAMRAVLVDHARARLTAKRGEGAVSQALPDDGPAVHESAWRILALDEALTDLAESDPELSELAQLRIFAGLSRSEIAAATGVCTRTVERRWREVRAWLVERL